MEDAMIINKSSYERGFKHASVYKTELIGWDSYSTDPRILYNIKKGTTQAYVPELDQDGLPYVLLASPITIPISFLLYCIVLYCIVLYCIVLYCIVLYCIVLYCILLYCIVFYSILFYFLWLF